MVWYGVCVWGGWLCTFPFFFSIFPFGFFLTSEIGVALTTFGGLFMLLGVMLFFDGALLALGNVGDFLPLPISFDKEAHIYPPPSPSLSLSQKELEETTDCHTYTYVHTYYHNHAHPCFILNRSSSSRV